MARHSRRVLPALVIVAGTFLAAEISGFQSETQPPREQQQQKSQGREERHDRRLWWRDPRDMAEIGLSAGQSATIDGIFKSELEKMKPLREAINRMEKDLNATIRANTTEVAVFTKQVEKIEKTRAELNTMRTVMLYRIRRVLSDEQHRKVQAMMERREAERRRQDDRRQDDRRR